MMEFSDISLKKRISLGTVNVRDMRDRAVDYYLKLKGDEPLEINGEYGCPVCLSRLSKNNRLVRENGYIVCDYCVTYIEDNL